MSTKDAALDVYAAAAAAPASSSATASGVFARFSQWRESLALPSPGTVEHLQREAKSTQVSSVFMEGGRADMTKTLSMDPIFQVIHGFQLGTGSHNMPSLYTLTAIYGTNDVFAHGTVDHEGNLSGRYNKGYNSQNTLKLSGHVAGPGHSVLTVEHDFQGRDSSVNLKTVNLWPTDMTGVFAGSYLQSFTKNLALGFETIYQRQSPELTDLSTSYIAKYVGSDKNWIGTAIMQPIGLLSTTYWQKLGEKVEVSAELTLMNAPHRREAQATLATKYDLRMATFRAQLESSGKVSAWLEQRFSPAFTFSVGGEIDHWKNAAKIGVGVQIESSSMMPEDMPLDPSMLTQ
ncbi:eukaryotic porin/Tom40 [Flagelloscypha sp. PMI_526]|nr:eukaryotic porin/Tom40 [Flagelloscypha sp. PMI_526]